MVGGRKVIGSWAWLSGWGARLGFAVRLWPGLPQLWRLGSWSALAVAVGFGLLLNLLLLCSVVWTEVASPGALRVAWCVLLVSWAIGALVFGRRMPLPLEIAPSAPASDLYPEALAQYLKGNWFEAETLCRRTIRHEERDADSRLLLASVLRRAGRLAEAWQELDQLELLSPGRKWEREIADERRLMAESLSETEKSSVSARESESADPSDGAAQTVANSPPRPEIGPAA